LQEEDGEIKYLLKFYYMITKSNTMKNINYKALKKNKKILQKFKV